MELRQRLGIRVTALILTTTPDEFLAAAYEPGYPHVDVCTSRPRSRALAGSPRAVGQPQPPVAPQQDQP